MFQNKDNKEAILNLENGMMMVIEKTSHKFDIGQQVILHGMDDYPQYNAIVVEIIAFRKNGTFGLAYYFKSDNSALMTHLNWIYEYRLTTIN